MRFDEAKRSWENRAKSGKLQKHRLATVQKKNTFLSESTMWQHARTFKKKNKPQKKRMKCNLVLES